MLSEAQLKARVGKITSSVAAGVLGVNPRMTQLEAWMRITGRLPPVPENKAMRRGNRLEELVLDYPAEELGLVRTAAPFRQHPDFPWAGDSADALYWAPEDIGAETSPVTLLAAGVRPTYVGEGKTASGGVAKSYGEEGSDDVHPGTLVQSHWHHIHWPEVSRRSCLVPVLVGGFAFEFRIYYVARNDEFAAAIMEDCARWHRDHVVADKPPPASKPGDTEHLLSLFPRNTLGLAEPTAELERLALEKDAASDRRKAAEADEEMAKTSLRELLGLHSGAQGRGWRVRYQQNRPTLKADYEAALRHLGGLVGASDRLVADCVERHTTERAGARPLVVTLTQEK